MLTATDEVAVGISAQRVQAHSPGELVQSDFTCNPVDKAGDADVHSGMFLLRAVEAPAGDALEYPVSGLDGQTDQRTAGVALTRVLAALGISGAEHVAGDLIVVPIPLVAQIGADHRHINLVEHHLIAGAYAHTAVKVMISFMFLYTL